MAGGTVTAGARLDQTLEQPQQPGDVLRGDDRASVGHRQERPSAPGARRDLDLSVGPVVPDGVVHQVGHQSFGQPGVSQRERGAADENRDVAVVDSNYAVAHAP
ncbi:MAG: hypothetical protein ABSB76_32220 [Streptosporangiaceae bacterium]